MAASSRTSSPASSSSTNSTSSRPWWTRPTPTASCCVGRRLAAARRCSASAAAPPRSRAALRPPRRRSPTAPCRPTAARTNSATRTRPPFARQQVTPRFNFSHVRYRGCLIDIALGVSRREISMTGLRKFAYFQKFNIIYLQQQSTYGIQKIFLIAAYAYNDINLLNGSCYNFLLSVGKFIKNSCDKSSF